MITNPFLHSDFEHLIGNTIPYLLFSLLACLKINEQKNNAFHLLFWGIATIQGLGTWLIGTPSIHIGASGVVFGLFSFVLLSCLLSFDLISLIASLVIYRFFDSFFWGMMPMMSFMGISWEAHLTGFFGGLVMGLYILLKDLKRKNE